MSAEFRLSDEQREALRSEVENYACIHGVAETPLTPDGRCSVCLKIAGAVWLVADRIVGEAVAEARAEAFLRGVQSGMKANESLINEAHDEAAERALVARLGNKWREAGWNSPDDLLAALTLLQRQVGELVEKYAPMVDQGSGSYLNPRVVVAALRAALAGSKDGEARPEGCSCPDGDQPWHDLGSGDCMYDEPKDGERPGVET